MRSAPGREVSEDRASCDVPLWTHPEWTARWNWLVQGTTGSGEDADWDFGLSGDQAVGAALGRWRRLREALGVKGAVHARQVHGSRLAAHRNPVSPGLLVMEGFDGHVTAVPDFLLTVSVADCVPVFMVEPERRNIAVVHAGWRGVAGGIVEAALEALGGGDNALGTQGVWVHAGPAICGSCYEVGPEVHAAVNPSLAVPDAARPVDLRAAIAHRAAGAGVLPERITRSTHCTRCGLGRFFSHRGGSASRQMAILALLPGV